MRRLKLVIADDHALMVEAVKIALEERPEFEIVGVAESGAQVLPVAQQTKPDLVLLDLSMPGIDGLRCLQLLQERMPSVKVVVLSGVDSDEMAEEVLRLGASAFISKRVEPEQLPEALAAAHEETVDRPIGRSENGLTQAVGKAGLTSRELEILRALSGGHSNKAIAKLLWLAEQTVKFHLTNIYRKLHVSSRTEAVHWAYRHGLLDSGGDAQAASLLRAASGRT